MDKSQALQSNRHWYVEMVYCSYPVWIWQNGPGFSYSRSVFVV